MGKIPLPEVGTRPPFLAGLGIELPGTLLSGNTPCPQAFRAVSGYPLSLSQGNFEQNGVRADFYPQMSLW